jgi:nitroreductase
MKQFFSTYGGAPVFIMAYAGKGPSGQWDTHSTALALQNLLLAAHAEGLGAVWTDGILIKEAEIKEAEAELRLRTVELENTQIKAPFDGIVTQIPVKAEQSLVIFYLPDP